MSWLSYKKQKDIGLICIYAMMLNFTQLIKSSFIKFLLFY